jgi:hypothetical protein
MLGTRGATSLTTIQRVGSTILSAREGVVELANSGASFLGSQSDRRSAHCAGTALALFRAALTSETRAALLALVLSGHYTRVATVFLLAEIASASARSARILSTHSQTSSAHTALASVTALNHLFQIAFLEATSLSLCRAHASANLSGLRYALLATSANCARLSETTRRGILPHKLLKLNLRTIPASQIFLTRTRLNCQVMSFSASSNRNTKTTNTSHLKRNTTNNRTTRIAFTQCILQTTNIFFFFVCC